MTVSLEQAEAKLLGNGATTVWSLGFELLSADDLVVELWAAGLKTVLVPNVDYTVADLGNELGASITYPISGASLASGNFLYIRRQTPMLQPSSAVITNELDSTTIEYRLDKLTMMVQELQAKLARTLVMATQPTEAFSPVANGFFATDGNGTPTIVSNVASSLNVISGIVVAEFATVAALETDVTLGYSGGLVNIAVGDIVRAGGYSYQALGSGDAGYDLQTAGGVRLLALDMALEAFGSTSTATTFASFASAAAAVGLGIINTGTQLLTSISLSGLSQLTLWGFAKSVLKRAGGVANLLSFSSPAALTLRGFRFDGAYAATLTAGHGLILIDGSRNTIDNLAFENFGGPAGSSGGAGILSYPADGASKIPGNIVSATRFDGLANETSFGLILASADYSLVYGSIAENLTNFGLEFKNNTTHSVMGLSAGVSCRYSFGTGYEGSPYAEHNIFGLLASKDSDIGFLWSHAKNNLLVGLNVDADTQPDTFGDGNCYGLHIETNSDENVALGVMVAGAVVDYPVRIRGSKNVVQIADFSAAGKTATINSGAGENYVEFLHIGDKAPTIKSLITDQNSPIITSGPGANIYDSPTTREYFGATTDAFTWGLDGLAKTYAYQSTQSFRFEGKAGSTIFGLGVETGKETGLRIVTPTAGAEGSFTYQFSATPWWRWDVGQTQIMRLDTQALQSITAGQIDLGKDLFPWGDAFVNGLRFVPQTTQLPLNNTELTFVRLSNTSVALKYKGTDGVVRTNTLTFT